MSHDPQGLELPEELPLQGLAHVVPPHLRGGLILNLQVPLGNLVSQEEVPDVEGSSPLARVPVVPVLCIHLE
jgi:hypothetical protein